MAYWNKDQLAKIARLKEYEFVESEKEGDKYKEVRKYGIAKETPFLKDVINEGYFHVNNKISNLQRGYYYFIDIKPKTSEFKSQNKTVNIAYALYKENKADTYGNTVFQINVNSLIDGTSNPLFDNESFNNISDLIGKLIHITQIKKGGEDTNSRHTTFTGISIPTTPEELAEYNVPLTEEDIANDYLLAQWEFEQNQQTDYQSQYEVFEYWDESMWID